MDVPLHNSELHRRFHCEREECKKEWKELAWSEDEDDEDPDMHMQHCEWMGCHEIYIWGKNGWDCSICGIRLCEFCEFSHMSHEDDWDPICHPCKEFEDGQ
jgi:hypothetical protein